MVQIESIYSCKDALRNLGTKLSDLVQIQYTKYKLQYLAKSKNVKDIISRLFIANFRHSLYQNMVGNSQY